MKIKFFSLLILLSLTLTLLVSCGGTTNDGGTTNSGGGGDGDEQLTSEEKNRMTLAKELANEVDEVKSLSSVVEADSTVAETGGDRVEKSALIRDENSLDADQSLTNYEWVDEIISKLKSSKNQALEVCKCLNTWVKIGEGDYSSVYRINYDANTDTVAVEYHSYPSDFNAYSRFTVTLDADGKSVIDSYSTAYKDDYITDTTELHYYEDKYYFSLTMHRMEDGTAHEDTLFLDLENKIQTSILVNSTTYFENGIPVRYEYQIPEIEFNYEDEKYVIRAGADSGSLSYRSKEGRASGGHIGSYNADGFSINLNLFEGWTSISREGDYTTLSTTEYGDVTVIGFTNTDLGVESGTRYSYNFHYFEGYEYAYIFVNFSEGEELSTKEKIEGAFRVLERELGISFKEELREAFINLNSRHSELLESFHFVNGIYAKDIKTADDYFTLLDTLRLDKLTLEELKEVYDGNGINKNDQNPENSYFEFLNFTLNGEAIVNASEKTISLADISAEIQSSLMLKDGGKYSLVFAWIAPGVIFEAGSVDTAYEGGTMSFESEILLTSDNLAAKFGEYRLVAFIAMTEEEKHERISKYFDITAASDATYTDELGIILRTVEATAEGISIVSEKTPAPESES